MSAKSESDINRYPRRTQLHEYFERLEELRERQEEHQDADTLAFEAEMAAREAAETE